MTKAISGFVFYQGPSMIDGAPPFASRWAKPEGGALRPEHFRKGGALPPEAGALALGDTPHVTSQ